jgi:putative ABC transport system substrate-binding protein
VIERRAFVAVIGAGLLAAPARLVAQPASRPPRVGYLFSGAASASRQLWDACRTGLRELGYAEGRSIALEPRWAEGHHDRLGALAAELVRLPVDVLVAAATPASRAARAATGSIPIVFVAVADPVEVGLAATLARPGGNATGLSLLTPELSARRLQLLVDVQPRLQRVAILRNSDNLSHLRFLKETEEAGGKIGIQVGPLLEARDPDEIDRAFRSLPEGTGGLIVFDDPAIWSHRARIVALAAQRRLPAMYGYRDFADEGGLISYGPDRIHLYRRTAAYVDRILKGARPADLPVEQPTKFNLVINVRAAKTLGLTVPAAILVQADHVVQ